MALQINLTNAHNENYPTAYARVHEFWGNEEQIRCEVLFYEDKTKYQSGEKEVERLGFTFPYTDGMTIADLYNLLKTQDVFVSAIDV
jgi:hypothetical protein